jgi:hypothetical protein
MKNSPEQSELWQNETPTTPAGSTDLEIHETAVSQLSLSKYIKFLVVLLVAAIIFITTYFSPNKDVTRFNGLEACKKQCSPRFGEIKGEPRIPNSSPLERRYSEINVKCVCS